MSIALKNDAGTFSTNLNQSNPTANVDIALPTTSGTMARTEDVIGVGQTRQNMTASRSIGTQYINDTGKPIKITIRVNATANAASASLTAGGNLISAFDIATSTYDITISEIILDGETYVLSGGSISIVSWSEIRQ